MKKIIIIILILAGVVNSYAQVDTKTFDKNKAFENYPKFKISQKKSPVLKMPQFDIAAMLEEDEAVKGMDVPFRFGKGFDVNYTLKDGNWENTNNGRIWNLMFQSEGAYSINFIFSELFLPEGGELYLYNTEGTMVYGPVTSKQNLKKGTFLTDLVQGDAVTIHIFEPEKAKDKTSLTISRVVHAYKDTYRSFSSELKSAELTCHNNVDCYSNWEDESDGVAWILLSTGITHCSGALVNNTANDYTPHILSAFHCLDPNVTSWLFKFGFRENDCGGMNYSAKTYNGANVVSAWDSADFALLEMVESPVGNGNIAYQGWDNRANTPTSGTCIHHPAGDYMKISFDNNALTTNNQIIDWTWGTDSPVASHWIVGLDNGSAEGGSSGCPLFDQNSRIVGQLHGGSSGCAPVIKKFGRFDVSWEGNNTDSTQLEHWLDPNNTGNPTTDLLRSPSLTVPDIICYGGHTVSMQNPPSGVTITWGGTNVSYPNGNTGTSVTVRAASSSTAANGTVTASFTVNGNLSTISHPVWVGAPGAFDVSDWDKFIISSADGEDWYVCSDQAGNEFDLSYYSTYYGCTNFEIKITNLNNTYTYDQFYSTYGIGDLDYPNLQEDWYLIWARGYNCGGWGDWTDSELEFVECSLMRLFFSPNPTTGETTLSIESTLTEKTFDDNTEWDLEIYSPGQVLTEKKTKLKGSSTKIQTQGWEEGVYVVRVKYKDEILTDKLLVKK